MGTSATSQVVPPLPVVSASSPFGGGPTGTWWQPGPQLVALAVFGQNPPPTAAHQFGPWHAMPNSWSWKPGPTAAGSASWSQLRPPFTVLKATPAERVAMLPEYPTTQQSTGLVQEIPVRYAAWPGRCSTDQLVPPSAVARTPTPPPRGEVNGTQQRDVPAQAIWP